MLRRLLTFLFAAAATCFLLLYGLYDGDLHQVVEPVTVRMVVDPPVGAALVEEPTPGP